jgi:ABC-2 type transport system permease protein
MAMVAAFMRRDWAIQRSYRFGLAFQIISTLTQLTIFFYLGKLVDRSKSVESSDLAHGYFGFAVLGLALLAIVLTGLGSVAQRIREDQTTGTLEALLVSSAPSSVVVLGSAAFDLLRATAGALGLIAIAIAVFGFRPVAGLPTAVALVVGLPAFVGLLAALGVVLASFTVVFKETTAFMTLIVTGLSLLGGVYYPVDLLPGALQQVAELLPITWGLDFIRAAVLDDELEFGRLALLIGSSLVLLPLSLKLFGAAVTLAKRSGSLTQY